MGQARGLANDERPASFGEVLRELRLAAGLSQEALAERARMSPGGISVLERGLRRAPYRDTVALLADGLRLSAEERARLESAAKRPALARRRSAPGGSTERGAELARSNLPVEVSSFVGRTVEVAEIGRLLRKGRVVTIAGPGGVGKTRTALQAGRAILEDAHAGVWFVDLGPLREGAFVASTIAHALRLEESPGRLPLDDLLSYLARKTALLILDNCEHVVADAAGVATEIVQACAEVRILATSREPLKIPGERVYRLRPLDTPSPEDSGRLTASAALAFGAIALFADRAEQTDSRFTVTDENAALVAEICRRLDGLPLAIELAAARMGTLSLKALAENLDRRLALLARNTRKPLPRQQTMRALVDWSYELLSPAEQRLFEQLSIFAGGCTLAAASEVCEPGEPGTPDILDGIASLVEKSLVVADLDRNEPRYALLESSRRYAREKLDARGEGEALARRHARAYCALAERFDARCDDALDSTWLETFEAELENWRTALEWSLAARHDVELGQRLAGALRPVWVSVTLEDGRRWVRAALELVDESTPQALVALLEYAEAGLAVRFAEAAVAVSCGERALARYRALGDQRGIVRVEATVAQALLFLGRVAEAETLLSGALGTARRLGTTRLAGFVLENIAFAHSLAGEHVEARSYYAKALATFRSAGDERSAAISAGNLAEAEFHSGNRELALRLAQSSLEPYDRLEPIRVVALANIAAYLIALDRYDEAQAYAIRALELAGERRQPVALAWALQHLAAVAGLRPPLEAEVRVEQLLQAARLLGFVDVRLASLGAPRQRTELQEYERVSAALRAALPSDELERQTSAGAAMSEDAAMTEALEIPTAH